MDAVMFVIVIGGIAGVAYWKWDVIKAKFGSDE